MNKKINIIIIIVLLFFLILSMSKQDILVSSILSSTKVFYLRVFPFMFFSIFINNLLLNYNFPMIFKNIFKSDIYYIFIMSILSGSPSNYVIIANYLDKGIISDKDASFLICFTSLCNPFFLFSYLSIILKKIYLVYKCLLIIYLGNFILFLFLKRKIKPFKRNIIMAKDYISPIIKAINKTTSSLINIMAIIIIFKAFSDLILPNNNHQIFSLFRGFIEVTQGLNSLLFLNINNIKKAAIFLTITAFNSFSIHMQMAYILRSYKINYLYFYLSRIFLILFNIIILIL